jgi:hypothetical protein
MSANFEFQRDGEALVPQFPDDGIEDFTRTDTINREAVRWLWNPGDMIETARKLNFKDSPHNFNVGGEEIESACLWRSKPKNYLRRGQFTPLEVGPHYHIKEDLDVADLRGALNTVQNDRTGQTTLYGIGVYPGNEIRKFLKPDPANQNIPKGIVEITSLLGRKPVRDKTCSDVLIYDLHDRDVEIFKLQRFFFPKWPELPVTLSELEDQIHMTGERLKDNPTEFDAEKMIPEMLRGCGNFRLWGTAAVEQANQRISGRMGVSGYTHQYNDIDKILMKQLEIEPLTIAQQRPRGESAGGFTKDDLKEVLAANADVIREIYQNTVRAKPGPKPKEA